MGQILELCSYVFQNGLELKGSGTPAASQQPPPPPPNAATTYATANFDIGGRTLVNGSRSNGGGGPVSNGSIVGVGGAIQSSTQNILEDTGKSVIS